ncbi:hypothetical protein C5167_004273 [Papaver somniferum]|nr:hypothetical protein C5167_004273 [Papaver somniferum]
MPASFFWLLPQNALHLLFQKATISLLFNSITTHRYHHRHQHRPPPLSSSPASPPLSYAVMTWLLPVKSSNCMPQFTPVARDMLHSLEETSSLFGDSRMCVIAREMTKSIKRSKDAKTFYSCKSGGGN